ncbi:hypothetical protein ABTZ44_16880 [Microbacterium oxydans]|uniref:hypothetical protein n=1 Tax=Microbacterium TaxID=33882 RepID=UPI00187D4277|nr:hypothetical protein [Microbacterium sp. R1]MBE7956316.1 hypothetical protein [Microbacterium sp. R1]
MPVIVWICVIAASWLGGTCAQLSSVLNVPSPTLGAALYWLAILQMGSIPVTLLASLPLLFMSGAFERRETPLRTRSIALALVALATLAISVLAYVLLNRASAGSLDEGSPFNGIARDAATLTAFHLMPLLVLLAVQAARPAVKSHRPEE